jgi:Type III flagellar switch regulator (C-ring) FliN C-term
MLETEAVKTLEAPAWPRVDRLQSRWRSAIGHRSTLTLSDGDGGRALTAQLSLRGVAQWQVASDWPMLMLQLCDRAATPARLSPHPQWEELQEAALQALEPELRHAVAAHVSSGLRRCIGRCLQSLGVSASDAAVPLATDADPTAIIDTLQGVLQLHIYDDDPLGGWLALVPLRDLPEPQETLRSAPAFDPKLPCRAVLGIQRLTQTAVRRLRPGDAVLLSRGSLAPGQAWLAVGQHCVGLWTPQRAGNGTSGLASASAPALLGPAHRSFAMNTDEPQHTSSTHEITLAAEAVVDAPPQRLSQIGRWSVGDLITLAAGPSTDQVRLRVDGRTLARGRLVAVGEVLAFEIIELFQ